MNKIFYDNTTKSFKTQLRFADNLYKCFIVEDKCWARFQHKRAELIKTKLGN